MHNINEAKVMGTVLVGDSPVLYVVLHTYGRISSKHILFLLF